MSTMRPNTIGIDASRGNRPNRTGVEWYVFHVVQRLKQVIPTDTRVLLYVETPLQDGLEKLPPNWEARVLRWPVRFFWTQIRLAWEMLVRPPDLLFVPGYVPPFITPKRTLTTLHDVAFVPLPSGYTWKSRAWLRLMNRVAVRAGRVLTVSAFSKAEIVRYLHAKPEQVTVTPLGFDAARFRVPDEGEIRSCLRKYGIARPYFIFVGRLESKKNLRGMLESFRAYRKAHPDTDAGLLLVGRPGHGYHRDMRAMGEDIRPHVLQPGYVAPDDMAALYAGAIAFLFISHYEGFGIPLLEAFACGTPVIGSDRTSIPEIAGDAALLVPPTDIGKVVAAMTRLTQDAALRDTLRQRGFARLQAFSWEKTARETWAVMAEMLAKMR